MKTLVQLFLFVVLSGCTQLVPANAPDVVQESQPVQEQLLFNQAFDQWVSTQNLNSLREFQKLHQQSAWGARAEIVIRYVEELHQRKLQLEEKRVELQQLQADNLQLTGMIEQLKKLLIELEQRPK